MTIRLVAVPFLRCGRILRYVHRVRSPGVVGQVGGLALGDHLCWRYDGRAEFQGRAAEFLTEGLKLGQRVCYVGAGDAGVLADELADAEGMADALDQGAAQVLTIDPGHGVGAAFDPVAQLERYVAATEDALAEGFTGLRLAVDVTPLMRGQAQLGDVARHEHLLDRYVAANPIAAMCALDGAELSEPVIERLACMHPTVSPGTTRFRLHATERSDCVAALGGELDLATIELFELAFGWADLQPVCGELAIEATDLDFIDHRHLILLAAYAGKSAANAVLRTHREGAARIVEVLKLKNVRVEPLA